MPKVLYRYIDGNSCTLTEKCVGAPGWRRLLEFSSINWNLGTKTMAIGKIDYNLSGMITGPLAMHNVYEFSACHMHYHFMHYGSFTFGDQPTPNSKRGFCLQSTDRLSNNESSPLNQPYWTCDNQGIEAGWADNYSESVPRLLEHLSGPRLGLVGPWAHSYPFDVTVEPAIGWLQEVLRWCDHWMKGRATGIMDEPMYRVWMQEGVPPQTCYHERTGRWVGEPAWPSPGIEMRRLHLNAGGLGPVAEAPSDRPVCSPLWVGNGAGEVGRYGNEADWAGDQREDDGGSLVFLSDALTERVEILGAPLVHLRFSSDKPDALVSARLNDVWPDGRSTRVGIGLLNLSHRDSHEHPRPLVPGQMADATVEMEDTAYVFAPGHRIAVSLSTTYWPIAWPSPELATLTVRTGESTLVLPVRAPRPAEEAALRPLDPPESAPSTPMTHSVPDTCPPRRVTRDLLSGRITVDFPRWTSVTEMPDIGHVHRAEGLARYEITDGEPLSATTITRFKIGIERADGIFEHESHGRLTCDATHFRVEMSLTARENGVVIAERQWDERIPRDHV